ncbi:aminopeptidase P family protein [Shewanella phaeophyticola]|uniref:Aminopeptidase P family protein n=1 Tax=Shewanella phaeophyticola TaxID=2978345 RepID=A0ABT2P2C8_9GAMM|nr:aminopeptidase P family protein [Shewanella sp. KJ10-1]MCT8986802.1 aminopeptidase P family protein [Shewanella sp. KJ10-1]
MRFFNWICLSSLLTLTVSVTSISANAVEVLPMRDRAAFIDDILTKRVDQLLPKLMNEHQLDLWVIISREYNEDPVIKTLLPATWISARRTTILVFARKNDGTIGAHAIAPYNVGHVFEKAWDKETQPNQWLALNALIEHYQPNSIGINQSEHWAHADGLVATDRDNLLAHLPEKYKSKIVSAEPVAIGWLEQRIPEEIAIYKDIIKLAHSIIAEAFSNKVITPKQTTTDDVVWWLRERVVELKLQTWFHPTVSIQRGGDATLEHESNLSHGDEPQVILPGDLLHVDFGISYLRLNTDTQQHAYVLKPGETEAPLYLQKALLSGNQLQDIFTGQFAQGLTGNQVLARSRKLAISQGLTPTIYTHPLGYHGHGAGTTLGMWDSQQGVPGDGDYPLHLNTAYAIELNNAIFIDAWNKDIRIMLEEDAIFDQSGVWYLNGRQTELLLIKS